MLRRPPQEAKEVNPEELIDALCPRLSEEEEDLDSDYEPARAPLNARALWGLADRFFEEDGLVCCLACSLVIQVCSEEDVLRKACGCDVSQGLPGRLLLPLGLVGPPDVEVQVRLSMVRELRALLEERDLLTGLRARGADGLLPELRHLVETWGSVTSDGGDLAQVVRLILDVKDLSGLAGIRPQNLWTGGLSLAEAHELWERAAVAHIPARALLSVGELWWSILGPRSASSRAQFYAPPLLKYLREVAALTRPTDHYRPRKEHFGWLMEHPAQASATVFPAEDPFASNLHDWILARWRVLEGADPPSSGEPAPESGSPPLSRHASMSGLLALFPAGRRPLPHEPAPLREGEPGLEGTYTDAEVGTFWRDGVMWSEPYARQREADWASAQGQPLTRHPQSPLATYPTGEEIRHQDEVQATRALGHEVRLRTARAAGHDLL
jgi:hypothetical protein